MIARVVLTALCVLTAAPAAAQSLPIFDAHIHYSQPAWDTVPPERALEILRQANVRRAIVSSTPDEGTVKLYEAMPAMVVPFLRPYRTRADMATWTRDPAIAAYVEARLARGIYKGLGEVHFGVNDADAPVVRRLAELAVERGLFLQSHVDAETVEKLLTLYPRLRVLWAHAGMSASADAVGRLLDRSRTLWVELSLRADVASGGTLDPGWRALFLRHPDRFMVGTDTWTTSRWDIVADSMRDVQRWLAQLPRDVAERIAYRNGEALFP